ncbi:MAG: dihydroorotase [Candidatus Eremiobacter antarcticus]|nr:dihydroorotase [Candidatus Eremiobacteraeota bacterium]MBC5807681.1 dihydroorotase [Candidatus Eremiobacteraeota bacterium]PZR60498.1 MAG: dihydroorotase [Candidatus Eremiobacter sp. RRmetagenome_bin22]
MTATSQAAANQDFVGARVVDPTLRLDAVRTVVVRRGVVAALLDGPPSAADPQAERVDCAGMVLCPGFIDPHVHLRDPGDPHKETLASGLAAAAAGGFTAVAAMPNTRPALDSSESVERLRHDAAALGGVRCYPIGAITLDREGTRIAPLRSMAAAGAVAFSDDGATTKSLKALYNAARYASDLPQRFFSHCEDDSFQDGLMHEGEISDRLGVPGSPSIAEAAIAARDLLVAQVSGKAWHLCHVSAAQTLDVLRAARSWGVDATAEVTAHHLQCTDEMLAGFNARYRVNPPLRSSSDTAAMRRAVADGTITVFASDHAPHAESEKEPPFSQACVGFSGLEVAIGATFNALGDVPLAVMVANFSSNVAALLGVSGGTLAPGSPADITGLRLNRAWSVNPAVFASKGKVTPFEGMTFAVKPALTVVGGRVLMHDQDGDARTERFATSSARGAS